VWTVGSWTAEQQDVGAIAVLMDDLEPKPFMRNSVCDRTKRIFFYRLDRDVVTESLTMCL
jgi:hypothetical protein